MLTDDGKEMAVRIESRRAGGPEFVEVLEAVAVAVSGVVLVDDDELEAVAVAVPVDVAEPEAELEALELAVLLLDDDDELV